MAVTKCGNHFDRDCFSGRYFYDRKDDLKK